jgi:hypothetical protein
MSSYGIWRCVDHGLTDVSEKHIVSIFRVEKFASGEPVSAGGCRLSHQSETTSYKNREGGMELLSGSFLAPKCSVTK